MASADPLGGSNSTVYGARGGDDAPGLSALLDEYMQEVAQANSLQNVSIPEDISVDEAFPDLLGDFQLSEFAAQQHTALGGQRAAIPGPHTPTTTAPNSQLSFTHVPVAEAGRSDR